MKIGKTGIISDKRMLRHKSMKSHPQSPARLATIMSRLENEKYLTNDRIDFIECYERFANDQDIGLVYPQNYIEYIKSLWPKVSHRTDITVLDTYFNEQSQQIARLSAGGVLEGIDHIMNGRWKNGFSIIRPPGHHSGAKNTINGFCIFNNIAIGARYLQKRYSVQKVLILDYDIHQGDGTHHIFASDPSVLFVSVHRHDHGTYYPAGSGANFPNCGKDEAQGTKLNIPLNCMSKQYTSYSFQAPGDNQYIYIYNRIIHPIIQSFNPDVILVSSGFDAARFDPVGGFTATPNAFYYMTRRLQQFNKPLLCVLEGGYNFAQTAQAVIGVVKGLLQQQSLPEPLPDLNYQDIKDRCHLQKQYHSDIDEIIEHHSKYWKILASEELVKYTTKIKQNKQKSFGIVALAQQQEAKGEQKGDKSQNQQQSHPQQQTECTNQFYFAAGHMQRFKNLTLSSDRIQKWAYIGQRKFYESDFPQRLYAPKCYGFEGQYAVIQNVLFKQQEPIILDIKLSRQSKNPHNSAEKTAKEIKKQVLSTSHQYAFRIGGFTTPQCKQGGLLINDEATNKKILKKVVTVQNKELFCSFLRNLAQQLKGVKRHYFGTSILLVKGKEKSSIKWVDFHYWYDNCNQYDQDIVQGLENLQKFIISIDQAQ